MARPDSAPCRNGPKLIRPTPSGPNDAGSDWSGRAIALTGRGSSEVRRRNVSGSWKPDRIQHVGAGVGGLGQPRDRAVDAVGLVTVLAEEQVGPRVDHHVHSRGVGGSPQRTDEFGVFSGRPQPAALAVHGVLDVQADRAGVRAGRR